MFLQIYQIKVVANDKPHNILQADILYTTILYKYYHVFLFITYMSYINTYNAQLRKFK